MVAGLRMLGLLPILTALAVLATPPLDAFAQVITDDRLQEELERTDRALENADAIVGESRSQRAKDLLEQGHRVQTQAWETYRGGNSIGSMSLTLQARRFATRAVGFARSDDVLEQRARRELENADNMLRGATERIAENPSSPALRLLDEARAQIDRGRRQLGEQHFEASFRLALSAQRLIRQALEINDVAAGEPQRVERELERTDNMIERAGEPVRESHDQDAIALLDRATTLQRTAWESFRAGQVRAAVPRTREARQLAARAVARVNGPVSEQRVIEEIGATDRVLEQAREAIASSADPSASRVLENARMHQERANDLLGEGDLRPALAQTLVARRLATRAEELTRSLSR